MMTAVAFINVKLQDTLKLPYSIVSIFFIFSAALTWGGFLLIWDTAPWYLTLWAHSFSISCSAMCKFSFDSTCFLHCFMSWLPVSVSLLLYQWWSKNNVSGFLSHRNPKLHLHSFYCVWWKSLTNGQLHLWDKTSLILRGILVTACSKITVSTIYEIKENCE